MKSIWITDGAIFTVVGMFLALLWMKPGKREAFHYAAILLPYGVLLFCCSIVAKLTPSVGDWRASHRAWREF